MIKKKQHKVLNTKTFIVWFFVFIMTFSIGGYYFFGNNQQTESIRYNGYNMYKSGNLWFTKIKGNAIPFSYLPAQLEDIKIQPEIKGRILGKSTLYLTFDPKQENLEFVELARFELKEDLLKFYKIDAIDGMTNLSAIYSLPIIGCENATEYFPVVSFHISDTSNDENVSGTNETNKGKIYLQGNCIVMEGKSQDFIRLKDRLMYSLAGVIP